MKLLHRLAIAGFFLLSVSYLCLLLWNDHQRNRAKQLMNEIRALRIGERGSHKAEQIWRDYKPFLGNSCDKQRDCVVSVEVDNQAFARVYYLVNIIPNWLGILPWIDDEDRLASQIGLRPWFSFGEVRLVDGKVVGGGFGVTLGTSSVGPSASNSAEFDLDNQLPFTVCFYPVQKLHPSHLVRRPGNMPLIAETITASASAAEVAQATDIDLDCLTSPKTCSMQELMPGAWQDYLKDRELERSNPLLVQAAKADSTCR